MSEIPIAASTSNVNAPTSNTAAIVTLSAVSGLWNVISAIYWSYDGAPTAGNLLIEDVSGTTVFSVDITAAGPGFLPFPLGLRSSAKNTALVVTLHAGGSGVSGKVSVLGYRA